MPNDADAMRFRDSLKALESDHVATGIPYVPNDKQLSLNGARVEAGFLSDPINHPAHYTDGMIEVADFIADKKLDFFLGNVVKYVCRAGKKDPAKEIEDLKKAHWYLTHKIDQLET